MIIVMFTCSSIIVIDYPKVSGYLIPQVQASFSFDKTGRW